MLEPYIKSTVYDMTGGLQPAPADDGYNVAMVVYTPTGPCAKTKVTSQRDFINKYMVGTTMTPNDDISAVTAYLALAQNPLYVLRACPSTFLEGISCSGRSLLFDKTKKLLSNYYRFIISSINDELTYYSVAKGSNNYYTGTGSSGTSLGGTKDLPTLINNLLKQVQSDGNIELLSAGDAKIVSRDSLTFSTNIQNAYLKEIVQNSLYKHIDSSSPTSVSEGSYLSIGGKSYYFRGTGNVDVSALLNPEPISYGGKQSTLDSAVFLHLVKKKSNCLASYKTLKLSLKNDSTTLTTVGTALTGIINADNTISLNPADTTTVTTTETNNPYSNLANKNLVLIDSASVTSYEGAEYIAVLTTATAESVTTKKLSVYKGTLKSGSTTVYENYALVSGTEVNANVILNSNDENSIVYLTKENNKVYAYFANVEINNTIKTIGTIIKVEVATIVEAQEAFINAWTALKTTNIFGHTGTITLYVALADDLSGSSDLSSYISIDSSTSNTYFYYVASDNTVNNNLLKHNFLWVQINDVLYYINNGVGLPDDFTTEATTTIQMSTTPTDKNTFIQLLMDATIKNQSMGMFQNYFVSPTAITVSKHNSINLGGTGSVETIDQSSQVDQFAIVQNFPSTTNVFQYSYSLDEDSVDASGKIYDLTLNYKNGEVVEKWTFSFDSGKVDGYGVDQWYTRVQSDYFTMVSLTEQGTILNSYNSSIWGSGVGVPSFNVQYAVDALELLSNAEDGLHYDVLSDGSITNTTLASAMETKADELKAVYLASVPANETNVTSIKSFVSAANLKSYETRILAAGDRVPVNGFSVVLPGSYHLLLAYIGLYRNTANEFAPNFNTAHGTVSVSNLVQKWTKEERESLLDSKIETLKGGVTTDWYINDNVTAQKTKSYMSEEQNVRMTNTAVHLCEDNAKQFIGELNTTQLRETVTNRLSSAIQNRLFKGKVYTPAVYRVVCDDTNNPTSVIEQNQLVISLYASFTPSVKYVLIDHIIQPLSQI